VLLIGALVIAAPLLRGSVDWPVEATLLVLSCAAAGLTVWSFPSIPRQAVVLAMVVAVVAVELVPLPSFVHALSPRTQGIFASSLRPLGAYPAARPFALDLPATARELGKAVTCLFAFVAASAYSRTQRRKETLVRALALSAAVVSVLVLGEIVLGAQPLLEPRSPFVNPNHLAGLLCLTSFVGLGLTVQAHGEAQVLWACVFVTSVAVVFLSLSRSGICAILGGLALFVVLFYSRSRKGSSRRTAWLLGTVLLGFGVAFFLAIGPVVREFQSAGRDDLKWQLWPDAWRLARDFPLLGIGRGSFATVFPIYRTEPSEFTFTHLENEWLQLPIDVGWPTALLLGGTLAYIWMKAARRRDLAMPEIGLLAGTATLLLQQVFDFSTELLGVGVPMAVAFGLLCRADKPMRVRPFLLRSAVVVAATLGCGGLAFYACHTEDGSNTIATAPLEDVPRVATQASVLRPADYLPHAAAGRRLAAAHRCPEALPWLTRAMWLAPFNPDPHLDAARCLAEAGDLRTARREYRLVASLGRPEVMVEAAQRWTSLNEVLEIAPATPDGLLALGGVLLERRPEQARAVLGSVLEDYFDDRALLPLARATLRTGDHDGALALARRRYAAYPHDEEAYQVAVWSLITGHRDDEATAELEAAIRAVPGSPMLLALAGERALSSGRFIQAKRLAEEISPRSPDDVATRDMLVARALAGEGRLPEAMLRARSAWDATPTRAEPLILLARIAASAGRIDDATEALERASQLRGPAAFDYAAELSELRARAVAAESQLRQRLLDADTRPLPENP
jgi:Flp pilus assembly protein TadD